MNLALRSNIMHQQYKIDNRQSYKRILPLLYKGLAISFVIVILAYLGLINIKLTNTFLKKLNANW